MSEEIISVELFQIALKLCGSTAGKNNNQIKIRALADQ